MPESQNNEINRGYIDYIETVSTSEKSHSLGDKTKQYFRRIFSRNFIRLILLPFSVIYSLLLIIIFKLFKWKWYNDSLMDQTHKDALAYLPELAHQYPLHLYPIIGKALEIAFIKRNLRTQAMKSNPSIAEFAIGDGTLSSRIFSDKDRITAFDLNPYSLVHVGALNHVKQRIIADCINPPIADSGTSLVFSANFLHHISDKELTLSNWSKITCFALFNENTVFWASSWASPYILKKLGFKRLAARKATKIEKASLQELWKEDELNQVVSKYFDTITRESFFSEKVFFLSAICSSLMLCLGPPTPKFNKLIFNSVMPRLSKFITVNLAKILIEYDSMLRKNGTFIIWMAKSKYSDHGYTPDEVKLICPNCKNEIYNNTCSSCNKKYLFDDGMLFLLSDELSDKISYKSNIGDILGKEHL